MRDNTRIYNPHFETILCQCGCGTYFQAIVKTNKPKYMNDTHKKRAQRAKEKQKNALQTQIGNSERRDQPVLVIYPPEKNQKAKIIPAAGATEKDIALIADSLFGKGKWVFR